jgi:hypothetical protein
MYILDKLTSNKWSNLSNEKTVKDIDIKPVHVLNKVIN